MTKEMGAEKIKEDDNDMQQIEDIQCCYHHAKFHNCNTLHQ